ncbi:hypothetical protein D3Z48_18005 [Clostridiaceae bacterium]|nr:hypothetical protein [Clostridiaceae bacterium]
MTKERQLLTGGSAGIRSSCFTCPDEKIKDAVQRAAAADFAGLLHILKALGDGRDADKSNAALSI